LRIKTRIKNSIREYITRFLAGDDIDPGAEMRYSSGGLTDYDTAMKYSAVFACVRVLSETFASCPVLLYRKIKDDERQAVNDLNVYDILHNRPNDIMAPFNFKESSMMALNLGGNAVSQKLYNYRGDLVGLYHYPWNQVRITRENNQLVYKIRDGTKETTLARKDVFHVPGMSFDGIVGLSPIEYMSTSIALGLSYEQFGVNFYRNGANSSGVFTFPNELSDTAYDRLKKDLAKNYQGLANTGKPILLEGGGNFTQLTIKPADAELLGNKKFQIEDVARCYRMPMHLIQELSRSTNNNIEHQSLEFVMYTMLPWFKRYEENANMQLLTAAERKAGYYLEIKVDALLRGDAKSRAEAYAVGRQWGWLSVNDIRRLENLPPLANGNIYLQPLNFVEAGQPVPAEQTAQAMVEKIYNMITDRR
jgi:HK97 family phage portal protein